MCMNWPSCQLQCPGDERQTCSIRWKIKCLSALGTRQRQLQHEEDACCGPEADLLLLRSTLATAPLQTLGTSFDAGKCTHTSTML
jgi:hypothetical protein